MANRFKITGNNDQKEFKQKVKKIIEDIPEGNVFAGECDSGGLEILKQVASENGRTVNASKNNNDIFFVVK